MKTLKEELQQVVVGLQSNPQQIITIFFEDYVPRGGAPALAALDNAIKESGVEQFSFRPHEINHQTGSGVSIEWDVSKQGWPTIGWLRTHDLRLIIFTDDSGSSKALTYEWDYVLENVYGKASINSETFCDLRAESSSTKDVVMKKTNGHPLLLMNYFPDVSLNFGSCVKCLSPYLYPRTGTSLVMELQDHVAAMKKQFGKLPNFIALNYALGVNETLDETVVQFVEGLSKTIE